MSVSKKSVIFLFSALLLLALTACASPPDAEGNQKVDLLTTVGFPVLIVLAVFTFMFIDHINPAIPKKKYQVRITNVDVNNRMIYYDASFFDSLLIGGFGKTRNSGSGYVIHVDSRYDFDEVLEYIRSF